MKSSNNNKPANKKSTPKLFTNSKTHSTKKTKKSPSSKKNTTTIKHYWLTPKLPSISARTPSRKSKNIWKGTKESSTNKKLQFHLCRMRSSIPNTIKSRFSPTSHVSCKSKISKNSSRNSSTRTKGHWLWLKRSRKEPSSWRRKTQSLKTGWEKWLESGKLWMGVKKY